MGTTSILLYHSYMVIVNKNGISFLNVFSKSANPCIIIPRPEQRKIPLLLAKPLKFPGISCIMSLI